MAINKRDLNPTDKLCIKILREGRATAAYIADVGDYSTGNVRSRLRRLVEHDHVAQIYDGLYQLADDPLEGREIDVGSDVEARLRADRVGEDYGEGKSRGAEQSPQEDARREFNVTAMSFDEAVTDRRLEVLEEWLRHAREAGSVQKSDFDQWYGEDQQERTGYNTRSYWEVFAKPGLRQADGFDQPNTRTYNWNGNL